MQIVTFSSMLMHSHVQFKVISKKNILTDEYDTQMYEQTAEFVAYAHLVLLKYYVNKALCLKSYIFILKYRFRSRSAK